MITLPRLAGRIFGTPLAIEQSKLAAIVAAVGPRLQGMPMADMGGGADRSESCYQVTADGIAVIGIQGTLVSKTSGMDALSGLRSYADVRADFQRALADGRVRAILLDLDSPGGEVQGMFDLADEMYAARGTKPICAFASQACSAAYLLASTADYVVAPRDAWTGSVGIIAMQLDESGADEMAGLKYTAVYAGARKNDGNPHEPLSPEALGWLRATVDKMYGMFTAAVARNRGIPAAAIQKMESAVYVGSDGLAPGLVDEVGTFEAALALLGSTTQAGHTRMVKGRVHEALLASAQPPEAPAALPILESSAASAARMEEAMEGTTGAAEATVPTAAEIEARVELARAAGYAEAQQIADLCAIAGSPARTVEFIGAKKSAADVKATLLQERVKANAGISSKTGAPAELQTGVMPGTDATAGESHGKAKPWSQVLEAVGLKKKGVV